MGKINNTELYALLQNLATDDYFPITQKSTGDTFNVPIGILFGLVSGGELPSFNQNNTFNKFYPNASRSGFENVHEAVNNSSSFEVLETEIFIVVNSYAKVVDGSRVIFTTDYHFMMIGKGSYGQGNTQLTQDNFFWIRSLNDFNILSEELSSPVVEFIEVDSYDLPQEAINEANPSYTISDGEDTFFVLIEPSTDQVQRPRKIYRFTGDSGVYGLNDLDSNFNDFLLVEDLSSGTEANNRSGTFVREILVGGRIDQLGGVANAVNSSFRGILTADNDEIVRFIIQEAVATGDNGSSIRIDTLRYDWKKGQGIINDGSAVDSDFSFVDREIGETLSPSVSATNGVSIIDFSSEDIDTPESSFNLSDNDIVVDNNDLYVRVYYINSEAKSPEYKLFLFTGGNGTYGQGNTSVSDTDFTLVDSFDNISSPEIKIDSSDVKSKPFADIISENVFEQLKEINDKFGISIQNKDGIEEFSITNEIQFEGFSFDPANKKIVLGNGLTRYFYIHTTLGSNTTGSENNASKPFQSIDGVFDLFDKNTEQSDISIVIIMLNQDTYPINNTVPYINVEFRCETVCSIDLTNNNNIGSLFFIGNGTSTIYWYFNIPYGTIIDNGSVGGTHLDTEDMIAYINVDTISINSNVNNGNYFGRNWYIQKLRNLKTVVPLGRNLLSGDYIEINTLDLLNYNQNSGVFNKDNDNKMYIKIHNLIKESTHTFSRITEAGNGSILELTEITGDLRLSFVDDYIIRFNGTENVVFFTTSGFDNLFIEGYVKNLTWTGSLSNATCVFQNLIVDNWSNVMENLGENITFKNCTINCNGVLIDKSGSGTIRIDNSTIRQSVIGDLLSTDDTTIVEIGGLSTNATAITGNVNTTVNQLTNY